MRNCLIFWLLLLLMAWLPTSSGASPNRFVLDGAWEWLPVDLPPGCQPLDCSKPTPIWTSPEIAAATWYPVTVPGTFSEHLGMHPEVARQYSDRLLLAGCYRKRFAFAEADQINLDGIAQLELDRVAAYCEVWFDGHYLGKHWSAYAPSLMEIPPELLAHSQHELTVFVIGKAFFTSPQGGPPESESLIPLGFDPQETGLTGSVTLRLRPHKHLRRVHLNTWQDRLSIEVGVSAAAVGNCSLEITIESDAQRSLLYGPNAVAVAHPEQSIEIESLEPQTWSPEKPFLYELQARLFDATRTWETRKFPVGFRTLTVADGCFELNGDPYFLLGAASSPPVVPQPIEATRRQLELLRQAGVRILRFAYEPPPRKWLQICDEIGLMAWVEGPLSALDGPYDFTNPVLVNQATSEMVAVVNQLRNHPSVVLWTMGSGNCGLSPHPQREAARRVLQGMANMIQQIDPSRITQAEANNRIWINSTIEDWQSTPGESDFGWYQGLPSDWSLLLDGYTGRHPDPAAFNSPWVFSELNTGYSSQYHGTIFDEPLERMAAGMRIGVTGDETNALQEYQARRINKVLLHARAFRNPKTNRISGLFPYDSSNWFLFPNSPEYIQGKPLLQAIQQAYTPINLYLDLPRRNYLSGEVFEPTLTVIHDAVGLPVLDGSQFACKIFLDQDSAPAASFQCDLPPVEYGTSPSFSVIAIKVPEVSEAAVARVEVRLVSRTQTLAANTHYLHFANPSYAHPAAQDLGERVLIYDPGSKLDRLLARHKTKVTRLERLEQFQNVSGLLVGPGGFDDYLGRSSTRDILTSWVANGGRLAVFAQTIPPGRWFFKGPLPGGYAFQAVPGWPTGIDHINLRVSDHPIIDGLSAAMLGQWGTSGVVAELGLNRSEPLDPAQREPLVLADVLGATAKPHWYPLLVSQPIGDGEVVLCQMQAVKQALAGDPFAARLVRNIVDWAASTPGPIPANLPEIIPQLKGPLAGNARGELVARFDAAPPALMPLAENGQMVSATSYLDINGVDHPAVDLVPIGGTVYFDIDDRYWFQRQQRAELEFQVCCQVPSKIRIDYDSFDSSTDPAAAVYRSTSSRSILETNVWKVMVFTLPDAFFANRQAHGTDIRIVTEDGQVMIGPVVLRKLEP